MVFNTKQPLDIDQKLFAGGTTEIIFDADSSIHLGNYFHPAVRILLHFNYGSYKEAHLYPPHENGDLFLSAIGGKPIPLEGGEHGC